MLPRVANAQDHRRAEVYANSPNRRSHLLDLDVRFLESHHRVWRTLRRAASAVTPPEPNGLQLGNKFDLHEPSHPDQEGSPFPGCPGGCLPVPGIAVICNRSSWISRS